MIVTVLGGSAASTPCLIDWLASEKSTGPITVRLAGRDATRLDAVTRACRILAHKSPISVQSFSLAAWDQALQGADVVLIQVRVGGLTGRQFDETFPLEHRVPGDEGLGPGGLSCAVRTWPVLRTILQQIQSNAPGSLTILVTSPGSLLIRMAALEFPRLNVYAICELPFTTLKDICGVCRVSPDRVRFNYSGPNHLGWLFEIMLDGNNLVEHYRTQHPSVWIRRTVQEYGAVPSKYFHLHSDPRKAVDEQRQRGSAGCRAAQLAIVQAGALAAFQYGDREEIRKAFTKRPAPWYTEAIGPLLAALSKPENLQAECGTPFFLSAADEIGEVSERAYLLIGHTFRQLPVAQEPPKVHDLNEYYAEYERKAALSIAEPNPKTLAKALLAHPWISNEQTAQSLANAIWIASPLMAESERQFAWQS